MTDATDLTARLAAAAADRNRWRETAIELARLCHKADVRAERAEAAWGRLAEMVRSHDARAWAPPSAWEEADARAKAARAAVTAVDLEGPK